MNRNKLIVFHSDASNIEKLRFERINKVYDSFC